MHDNMSIFHKKPRMHIYMYIYPPAPRRGATRLRRVLFQSPCPKSFQAFQSQVDNQVFHSFPVISSPPVCNCQFANLVFANQQSGVCRSVYCRPRTNVLPPPGYNLNLGPPRVSLKNHQISSLSPRPIKIRKSAPRITKRHQNVT